MHYLFVSSKLEFRAPAGSGSYNCVVRAVPEHRVEAWLVMRFPRPQPKSTGHVSAMFKGPVGRLVGPQDQRTSGFRDFVKG